ncbi:hypothetical protein M407DRAFT_20240 [Tulasnella calospora MUT 4182]|uniref:Uncharacterized protein n=1 Tax=Tulasnella calospora MUT 4182 TaxID=1051891 RepID=A0A0C3QQD9_9AGAM|nr:hypothetical protein M407DRAFT_20240 [Tulasnella calospora MUT 4182]
MQESGKRGGGKGKALYRSSRLLRDLEGPAIDYKQWFAVTRTPRLSLGLIAEFPGISPRDDNMAKAERSSPIPELIVPGYLDSDDIDYIVHLNYCRGTRSFTGPRPTLSKVPSARGGNSSGSPPPSRDNQSRNLPIQCTFQRGRQRLILCLDPPLCVESASRCFGQ